MHNIKPLPQNPFALYDFLGYLVPGIVFVLCALYLDGIIFPEHEEGLIKLITDQSNISKKFLEALQLIDYIAQTILLTFYLVITYVIGQMVGILSSLTIGKIYNEIYGYPGNSLIKKERKSKKFENLFRPDEEGLLLKKCKKIYKEVRKDAEYNKNIHADYYFLIIYHYVIEIECPHLIQINNYRSLYHFFRSLCFIFLISFLIISAYHLSPKDQFNFHWSIIYFIFLSCLSFLGFDRFYKKFAKEVLYAALVNKPEDKTINLKSGKDRTVKLQIKNAKTKNN